MPASDENSRVPQDNRVSTLDGDCGWARVLNGEFPGRYESFTGLLQEKYGYTREHAINELDKRVTAFQEAMKSETEPSVPTE
jgi:hypothetical protein